MKVKSIAEIKQEFAIAETAEVLENLMLVYRNDERAGVQNLIKKAKHQIKKDAQEEERLEKMLFFERKYAEYEHICGIDEAGRGPLAGPVVAGAVILPKNCKIKYLNDSKQLSANRREDLFLEIMEKAEAVGVGIISTERIDEINILQATYEAMREAISRLSVTPDLLLNDAVTIPQVPMKQVAIVKGDAKSLSIAAASVIAKVTRDHIMENYDREYPEYGFAKHKGYGSAEHIAAIKKYGPSPIHRSTFIKNFV